MDDLIALVDALVILNDDNLAQRVIDNNDVQRCLSELQDMLAADMEPVVRCKDCKHRTETGNCGHPRHHGILPSAYPFDFCSYGKPKEDDKCDMVWI